MKWKVQKGRGLVIVMYRAGVLSAPHKSSTTEKSALTVFDTVFDEVFDKVFVKICSKSVILLDIHH